MMSVPARRLVIALCTSLVLLGAATSAYTSQRKTAMLVEVYSTHKCVGLDCPPWPVPDDYDFCFQVGESFYTGTYYPFGVPLAKKGKRLLPFEGKSVEIVVTDKHIEIVAPPINLRLKRVHDDAAFQLNSCSHN
jgi:hypothetical protein